MSHRLPPCGRGRDDEKTCRSGCHGSRHPERSARWCRPATLVHLVTRAGHPLVRFNRRSSSDRGTGRWSRGLVYPRDPHEGIACDHDYLSIPAGHKVSRVPGRRARRGTRGGGVLDSPHHPHGGERGGDDQFGVGSGPGGRGAGVGESSDARLLTRCYWKCNSVTRIGASRRCERCSAAHGCP